MAHHDAKDDRDVIKVRWNGSTYRATIDGESTTCTFSAEVAAQRLGAMVMDVPVEQVHLRQLNEPRRYHYKFQIINLN